MKIEDQLEINKLSDALNKSLSVEVKLGREEAEKIVVADLVAKYRSNVERGDLFWADSFKTVLRYYLTVDEIKALIKV